MEVIVLRRDGTETDRVITLDPEVFDIEPNDHVIWLDVKAIQANARQGTHKTKERGEVRGGGRKPWPQKGTGRARHGSIRSPLWVGGGRTFGPRPRKYTQRVNRKTKILARKSVLTHKAHEGAIRVVEDFTLERPRTREMADMLQALELSGKKVLLLTASPDRTLYLSGRNLPKFHVLDAPSASTLDLLNAQVLLFQESALEQITRLLKGELVTASTSEEVTE